MSPCLISDRRVRSLFEVFGLLLLLKVFISRLDGVLTLAAEVGEGVNLP